MTARIGRKNTERPGWPEARQIAVAKACAGAWISYFRHSSAHDVSEFRGASVDHGPCDYCLHEAVDLR